MGVSPETLVTGYQGFIQSTWNGLQSAFVPARAANQAAAAYPMPPNPPIPPTSPYELSSWSNYFLESLRDGPPDVTKPSKTGGEGALPRGEPTPLPPMSDPNDPQQQAIRLAYIRENESAVTLAENGYDIEQVQPGKGTKPTADYIIEGRSFDCYAPTTANVRNLASNIQKKVDQDQADRVVLNVSDLQAAPADVVKQLRDYPIRGLKEIIVVSSDPRYPPGRLFPTARFPDPAPAPPSTPDPTPVPTPQVPAPGPNPPPPTTPAQPGPVPEPPGDPSFGDV